MLNQVKASDSVSMQKKKQYINFREYRTEAKKRWGLSKQEAKAEWKTFLSDPSIPKSKDQRGWLTMPALHSFK